MFVVNQSKVYPALATVVLESSRIVFTNSSKSIELEFTPTIDVHVKVPEPLDCKKSFTEPSFDGHVYVEPFKVTAPEILAVPPTSKVVLSVPPEFTPTRVLLVSTIKIVDVAVESLTVKAVDESVVTVKLPVVVKPVPIVVDADPDEYAIPKIKDPTKKVVKIYINFVFL